MSEEGLPIPPASVTPEMLWVLLSGLREDIVSLRTDFANNVVRKDVYQLELLAVKDDIGRLRATYHKVLGGVSAAALTALGAWLYNLFAAHPHA